MIQAGFNFVNVNYVLMPDYHFPDPLIQISEAVNYLVEHGAELGLDMEDVVLFGQSAGAELAAQYAAVLSNGEYRALFSFTREPRLQVSDIRAAVIDDAPLEVELLEGLPIKILTGAYLQDSVFLWNKTDGELVSLCFDGVYMDCQIYVNRRLAKEWKYGYSAFEVAMTPYLQNGNNEIIVCVRHQSPNSRWYSGAGIYRDVRLRSVWETHIPKNGIYVTAIKKAERYVVVRDRYGGDLQGGDNTCLYAV